MPTISINTKELDALMSSLVKMANKTEEVSKKTVFSGAKVMADGMKTKLNCIPTVPDDSWGTPNKRLHGLRTSEKAELIRGFGISRVKKEGDEYFVKLGFFKGLASGDYKKSPSFKSGVPLVMLASQIDKGTSWMTRYPFVRPTFNAYKQATINAMRERFNSEVSNIFK